MSLFFVHIPKTAGTSFRLGAEKCFGKSRVWYDYGAEEKETSTIVKSYVYQGAPDVWALRAELDSNNIAMLGGHVTVGKFVSLLGIENTITFVRDPLQRIVSDYQHFVRHHGYEHSFRTFFSRPVMHNRIDKLLHGVNPEAIGFIGLTERYNESLEMFNARYRASVPRLEANQGKAGVDLLHDIAEEDVKELKKLNRRDLSLYEKCRVLFEARLEMYKNGIPYAHAFLKESGPKRISGWAWCAEQGDSPVRVEVWVNGEKFTVVSATEFVPDLCRLRPPRGGYVGFSVTGAFSPGDKVQCRVQDTGQWFPEKARTVPESGGR